jgi:hypothetical protein
MQSNTLIFTRAVNLYGGDQAIGSNTAPLTNPKEPEVAAATLNKTEKIARKRSEGRAKNRRVELVTQAGAAPQTPAAGAQSTVPDAGGAVPPGGGAASPDQAPPQP